MEKRSKNILVGIIIIGILIISMGPSLGLFASSSTTVSRAVQNTASPGQTITVTYTAQGSGSFGASIIDTISGTGCTFSNGKTEYKDVILSDGSLVRTMQIVMPSSGSCVLQGDYKVNDLAIVNFPDTTITVNAGNTNQCSSGQTKCESTTYYTCSSGNWISQGQVDGQCGYSSGGNNGGDNGDGALSFDLDYVIVKLGNFDLTIKWALIILGGLFIVKLFIK